MEAKRKANRGVKRFKWSAEGFGLSQALKDCAEICGVCLKTQASVTEEWLETGRKNDLDIDRDNFKKKKKKKLEPRRTDQEVMSCVWEKEQVC